ncbi:MAG: type II secretion system inner membrane protein GspF [Betaproteobacteria bacterium]|nr:type II secretion system inner membrane protein GspF [Betaproteobacteria bacterium]
MPGFRYHAYSIEGQLHKGVLEADSARQARSLLRDQGLTPHKVEVIAANDATGGSRFRTGDLPRSDVTRLTRSLASLLEAGLTVEQAFNALIEQADREKERQVLAALRGEVMAGSTIAKALESFPGTFPELYRTLVAAGEASGQLARVLGRLADYLEERDALRGRISIALVYPMIVLAVSILVMGALLVYVVPQVVQVYAHAKESLPFLTRALIAVSAFLKATWPAWIALVVVAVVAFRLALRRPRPRARIHAILMRTPLAGPVLRQLDSARFAATLAILVGSRVPILAAMEAGGGVMTLVPLREALAQATRGVREGMPLSRALGATNAFPPVMVHLIAGGEATGRLDESLERSARQQQADLSTRLQAAVAVFEPALIVIMGAVVFGIVLAILVPLFNLNQLVGR